MAFYDYAFQLFDGGPEAGWAVEAATWAPFAEAPPVPRIEPDTLAGGFGTKGLSGRLSNLIFGQMAREDSQVSSDLELLKSPILSARWYLEEGSADDAVVSFVADQLSLSGASERNPNVDFEKVLLEQLTAFEHGFALHEVYYDVVGGRNVLGGLEFRWQNSIEKFRSHRGQLTGVVQLVDAEDDRGTKVGPREEIELGRDRLAYFSPKAIGDMFRGESMLRAAYKPWFAKTQTFYADLIGTNRSLVPTPVGKYVEGSTTLSLSRFEKLLQSMGSHAQSYLLLPDDFMAVEWLDRPGGIPDIEWKYKYYNREISRALFGYILDLSESSSANRGLSSDLYDILFNFLARLADGVKKSMQRDIIDRLVVLNFGVGAQAPRLRWESLDTTKILRIAEAIKSVGPDFLQPDEALDDYLRDSFGFPARQGAWEKPPSKPIQLVKKEE